MKRFIASLSLAFLSAGGLQAGQAAADKVSADVHRTYQDAKDSLGEKKEDYESGIRAELDALKAKIADLEARAATMAKEVRAGFQRRVHALQRKLSMAEGKLKGVRSAHPTRREKLKAGLDKAMLDLKKAYEDLASSMK